MGLYALITLLLIFTIVALALRIHRLSGGHKELQHNFDETSLILESLNDGLLECDTEMIVLRANHATEKILGLDVSQVVNKRIDPLNPGSPNEKILATVLFPPKDTHVQDGQSYSYDVLLPSLQKKLRIFTILKTNRGSKNITGFIKIIRDVSIETVVEGHKNDLISVVSHQLLTPLSGIKWICKSLLDGDSGPLNERQAQIIKRGLLASVDMIELVTDILDATKVEQAQFAYKKERYDLVAFIKELTVSRAEKAGMREIKIDEQLPSTVKEMSFDRERMSIALGNILDNAIDYSPDGTHVNVALNFGAGKAEIAISDKGIGVPEAEYSHLFTKFYRADNAKRVRTGGTGLGLYLAKHIIEEHGGNISFRSKQNEGTTFTISLPDA